MGWAVQDADLLSLCGHPVETLRPRLQPSRRLLVLSADETTPQTVARLLTDNGFGASQITVLEALGGPAERIRESRAENFDVARYRTAEPDGDLRRRSAGSPGDSWLAPVWTTGCSTPTAC